MNLDTNFLKNNMEGKKESLEKMKTLIDDLMREDGENLHPVVLEYFEDKDLAKALFEKIKQSDIKKYIVHSSKFFSFLSQKRNDKEEGFFGKYVTIPETEYSDGRKRPGESGRILRIETLKKYGIDPQEVLFFRVTQSAKEGENKPEYYWTSNYFETKSGLQQEIPSDLRTTSIILVADLETINKNGGLIEDMNDCGALSVRQYGSENFDQNTALVHLRKN